MVTLLMEFGSRRIVRAEGEVRVAMAPGSTLKPLVLDSLLQSGSLTAGQGEVCPITLSIAGRQFSCVHPRLAAPLTPSSAIAYSCNNYVARAIAHAPSFDVSRALIHRGLSPGRVRPARTLEQRQLQALGEWGVETTPEELLFAYRGIAAGAHRAILEGLEGCAGYGTAQLAQVPGVRIAGKTGTAPGNAAWFAGFAPSRAPKFVIVVLTGGKSGGADAAPVAARVLSEVLR